MEISYIWFEKCYNSWFETLGLQTENRTEWMPCRQSKVMVVEKPVSMNLNYNSSFCWNSNSEDHDLLLENKI